MSTTLPAPPGSRRAYWACQIAGWYGYGLAQLVGAVTTADVQILGALRGPQIPWQTVALDLGALHTLGLLFSHVLHDYIRRRRWDTLPWTALLPRILAAGLVLAAPLGVTQHFMAIGILAADPQIPDALVPVIQCINWAAIFWLWMVIYFIALANRRRRYAELRQSELARELQAAQLRLLKAQVNPHFLFNSLNSVRALIADDPAAAQRAVTLLARTLRYSLASGDPPELVTLEQELETVADYLGLEALRLGERLRIERDIDAAALPARIPVMLVQTLVENAIKHGIAELPEGGALRISARVRDGLLRLEIENPRPRAAVASQGQGVGLRNGRERLRLLFDDQATLTLDLPADGAIARLRVPVGR